MADNQLNSFFAFCYYFNAIMGTGFLTVPLVFSQGWQSGNWVGLISTFLIFVLMTVLSWFVAKQLLDSKDQLERKNRSENLEDSELEMELDTPRNPEKLVDTSVPGLINTAIGGRVGPVVRFLGWIFSLCFVVGLLAAHANYIGEHASRMMNNDCSNDQKGKPTLDEELSYIISILLFGLALTFISSFTLQDMKWIQPFMTLCRILLVFLALITPRDSQSGTRHDWWFLLQAFPVFYIAFEYHISIPGIRMASRDEINQNKHNFWAIIFFSFLCLIFSYFCYGKISKSDQDLYVCLYLGWKNTFSFLIFLLLPSLLALSTASLYWRTFQMLVVSAFFCGGTLEEELQKSKWKLRFGLVHWPIYLVLWLLFSETTNNDFVFNLLFVRTIFSVTLIFIGIPLCYWYAKARQRKYCWYISPTILVAAFCIVAAILQLFGVIKSL